MADLQGDAWHAEQRRRSQDLIRVKNITDEDYTLKWDEGGATARFVVPSREKDIGWGKGMRVMQRYLAKKFTRELVDKIIFAKQNETLEQLKAKLTKQGSADVPYNANQQLMTVPGLRSDDPTTREPLEDQIWLGVEEEFGVTYDTTPIIEKKPDIMADPFSRLDMKRYQPEGLNSPVVLEEQLPAPKKLGRPPMKHDLSAVEEVQ